LLSRRATTLSYIWVFGDGVDLMFWVMGRGRNTFLFGKVDTFSYGKANDFLFGQVHVGVVVPDAPDPMVSDIGKLSNDHSM